MRVLLIYVSSSNFHLMPDLHEYDIRYQHNALLFIIYTALTKTQLIFYLFGYYIRLLYLCNMIVIKEHTSKIIYFLLTFTIVMAFLGCSTSKVIPEGSYSFEGVRIVSDNKNLNISSLSGYVRQQPNTKWFSLIRKPGAAPVIYDTLQTSLSCRDLQLAMQNMGYLHADVEVENVVKGNKLKAVYKLHPKEAYYIRNVEYDIQDDSVKSFIERHGNVLNSLKRGEQFSISRLNNERKRITSLLTSNGYYKFHMEFIVFDVDTAAFSTDVDVRMTLLKYRSDNNSEEADHPVYHIRSINYSSEDSETMHLRKKTLENRTVFTEGDVYSSTALQKTYNNFARMQAVRYTNIRFNELPDTTLLDCDIQISTNKPSTISFLPEGTNTSGDLGAAATLTYENRNLFRGSELFSIQARLAFEAITRLEGYSDQNYNEYGIESKFTFPRLMAPFLSRRFLREVNATSELSASYNLQNRPEFHRRLFSASWRYRWTNFAKNITYRFDLIDMNYVYMPWISETFRNEYLDNVSNRNAILRYNYEDLFIMKIGFGMTLNHSTWALRTNIETSGNLLNGIGRISRFKQNRYGQYTLFNIAYAQYVKGDIDFTKLIDFDKNNQLVIHGAIGIAYPYGNSIILPFEKRYFSGGANSVRGWSVRGLGPGRFRGTDGRIDFINQTGDLKLDLSMEYRTKLFWKVNGAAFIDAGNIWTLREYKEQPGGQFAFNEFYKEIAVAYGLGVRLNFSYFIVRFDFGMKAVDPAYTNAREHFPLLNPDLKRDLAIHFAVGMPF